MKIKIIKILLLLALAAILGILAFSGVTPALIARAGANTLRLSTIHAAAAQAQSSTRNVWVDLSMADQTAPWSESTVFVYADGLLVGSGKANRGIYRLALPDGVYDFAVQHNSLPVWGALQKDVKVAGDGTKSVFFTTPLERNLELRLRTPSDNLPKKGYTVRILQDGQEVVNRNENPNTEVSRYGLRTGLVYDLLVSYAGNEFEVLGIQLTEEGAQVTVDLPEEEGVLDVFVNVDGQPNTQDAKILVVDPATGKEVVPLSNLRDRFTVPLFAGAKYSVRVQLGQNVLAKEIEIEPSGLHPLTFEFTQP